MGTYIEEGRELRIAEVETAILATVERARVGGWAKRHVREMKDVSPDRLRGIAQDLIELNSALLNKRSVFAVCEKAPRNLDSGRHYYTIHYSNVQGKVCRLWLGEFTPFVGGTVQDRDRNMYKYIFESSAIGMSRLLDATDGVFSFLRSLGGCYAQINVI